MAEPHLAPSLVRLRSEINARWPHRDHSSDGWIGDVHHQQQGSKSDHNPNGRNSVNAIDIDKDGIDAPYVVGQAIKHPATNYVIFNRRIWSRNHHFAPRKYTGTKDPHTSHIHVSIQQTAAAEQNTQPWGITGGSNPAPPSYPAYPGPLHRGSKGAAVGSLQARLNERGYAHIPVDNDFGAATEDRVRKFQKFAHLGVDGVVGPATHKLLWTLPIS